MCILMTGAAAVLLLAGTAVAQSDRDADADGMINADEFAQNLGGGEFDRYDADGDGAISRDDYDVGVFQRYDTDRDQRWSQTEAGLWEDDQLTSGRERDGGGCLLLLCLQGGRSAPVFLSSEELHRPS